MLAIIYVDAFNLYYGCLKGTPYRWLDLAKLCRLLLPQDTIQAIKYFTALVSARPHDPHQPIRQQVYLRALQTLPNLSIHYGHFLSHPLLMPLADGVGSKPKYVRVMRTEEKGSDVNLATHLLHDAFRNRFELAVVISNDSDLLEPIRIVRSEFKKAVGILNPQEHPSAVLLRAATFMKHIRAKALAASQFPPVLHDQTGDFVKPEGW